MTIVCEWSLVVALLNLVLIVTLLLDNCELFKFFISLELTVINLCLPVESLVACFSLAIVDPRSDHGPRSERHKEEADKHVTDRHNVVPIEIVAANAESPIVAGRLIVVLRVTIRSTLSYVHC